MKNNRVPKSYFKPSARVTRGGNTSFVNREKERPLLGEVQGLKAGVGEEKFSRTLEKGIKKGLIREYRFRWTTLRRGAVGYKELDFLIITYGPPIAISVRGVSFVHKSAASQNQDLINDLIILKRLKELGFNVPKITNIDAFKLEDQKRADKVGQDLGVYR